MDPTGQQQAQAATVALASTVARAVAARVPIAAAWLFGSGAAGRLAPHSDLDLAVLPVEPIDPLWLAGLSAELSPLAGRELQLVDLRRAGPILGRQVLHNGVLVFDADCRVRLVWQAHVLVDYEDLMRMRAPLEQALIRRLRAGT